MLQYSTYMCSIVSSLRGNLTLKHFYIEWIGGMGAYMDQSMFLPLHRRQSYPSSGAQKEDHMVNTCFTPRKPHFVWVWRYQIKSWHRIVYFNPPGQNSAHITPENTITKHSFGRSPITNQSSPTTSTSTHVRARAQGLINHLRPAMHSTGHRHLVNTIDMA